MKHIFYLNAIFFIMYKMMWIVNPTENVKKSKLFSRLSKENKGKKWDDYDDEYKLLLKTKGLIALSFTLWMFTGLLSFNWLAFLFIILFNMIFINLISKPFKYNGIYTTIHWLNSIIGLAFGIFIIINSYHLQIDLYELLITWWNAT